MKTMSRLILVSLAGIFAALVLSGCGCGDSSVCGSGNTVISGPSVIPTSTPVASPSSTPDPCAFTALVVSWKGGAQFPTGVPVGSINQLDATPFGPTGPVADGCNKARFPTWQVLTPAQCSVLVQGEPYNPNLIAGTVGVCRLTATMIDSNRPVVSPVFEVQIR